MKKILKTAIFSSKVTTYVVKMMVLEYNRQHQHGIGGG